LPQAPLIARRDLLNHGASSEFVDWFRLRPIEVQVQTGGALGAVTIAWRVQGDLNWSAPEPSEPGTSWAWDAPDPAWASLVFPAGSYTAGDTWTVATSGAVVAQGSPSAGPPTATRYDLVALTCAAVTSDAVTWMQPRCVPPVLSLGEGQKGWLAHVAIYRLKSRQGMTPAQAGSGDENLRARALDAEENIKRIGRSDNRPPDIVDSSPGGTGAGIPQMPVSRSSRGFEDFS
jgi:hypothetical protein